MFSSLPVLFNFYFISAVCVARAVAFTLSQIQRQNSSWSHSDNCGVAGDQGCACVRLVLFSPQFFPSLVVSGWEHGRVWEVGMTWLTEQPGAITVKPMTDCSGASPGGNGSQSRAAPAVHTPTGCFSAVMSSLGAEADSPETLLGSSCCRSDRSVHT